ncbi:hypothetical protein B0H16DRAFT_1464853 [Mycena metata]|uniref:Uncharacterized protein n=1 Tax=Mycena metata TaxID=1033252 RepID=A0AAD7N1T8_9AGAR|nr:hypothetical protein B0H16DRAFT_1464853 [Mycena metata]
MLPSQISSAIGLVLGTLSALWRDQKVTGGASNQWWAATVAFRRLAGVKSATGPCKIVPEWYNDPRSSCEASDLATYETLSFASTESLHPTDATNSIILPSPDVDRPSQPLKRIWRCCAATVRALLCGMTIRVWAPFPTAGPAEVAAAAEEEEPAEPADLNDQQRAALAFLVRMVITAQRDPPLPLLPAPTQWIYHDVDVELPPGVNERVNDVAVLVAEPELEAPPSMGAETVVAEDGKEVVGEEHVDKPDIVALDVSGDARMEAELLEEQEAVDDAQESRRDAGKGAAEDVVLAETKVEREGTRTQVPLELDELVLCPSVHRVILPCSSARSAPIHRATPSFPPASTFDRLANVVEVAELAEPEPGHSQSVFAACDVVPEAPHVPPATEEELCGAVFASPSIANAKWTAEPVTPPQPRVLPTNLLVRKVRMLPFSGSAAVGPPASPSPPSRRCRERCPTLSVAGPPSPPARHDHPLRYPASHREILYIPGLLDRLRDTLRDAQRMFPSPPRSPPPRHPAMTLDEFPLIPEPVQDATARRAALEAEYRVASASLRAAVDADLAFVARDREGKGGATMAELSIALHRQRLPTPFARSDAATVVPAGTGLMRDSEGLGGAEVEEKENGVDQKGKGRAEVSGTTAARARAFLSSTPLTGLSTSNAGAGLGLSASTLLRRIDERPAYERRRIHGQLGALVGEAESASRDELSFVHFHAAMLPRPFGQPLAGEDEET